MSVAIWSYTLLEHYMKASFLLQMTHVVSMHTEEYEINQLVKNDALSKMLKQCVTPNGNPH